jgi:glycosyltransferase involved in cell wall biosynthesis
VLVEAMACGTPVLGARMGSIPEIVVDGETGFLCDDVVQAVARVPELASLSRAACRAHVEREFTVERMIERYVTAYNDVIAQGTPPLPTAEQLRWRSHDWWDRPMAFTEVPPKPARFS